jgi:EpsI family protein
VSQSLLTLPDPRDASAPPISVNRYLIERGLERQLVLYWYQGRGRIIGSEYMSKFYLMWDAAWRSRTDAAIVRVVVPQDGMGSAAEDKAEKAAVAFVNELLPALNRFLPN